MQIVLIPNGFTTTNWINKDSTNNLSLLKQLHEIKACVATISNNKVTIPKDREKVLVTTLSSISTSSVVKEKTLAGPGSFYWLLPWLGSIF